MKCKSLLVRDSSPVIMGLASVSSPASLACECEFSHWSIIDHGRGGKICDVCDSILTLCAWKLTVQPCMKKHEACILKKLCESV